MYLDQWLQLLITVQLSEYNILGGIPLLTVFVWKEEPVGFYFLSSLLAEQKMTNSVLPALVKPPNINMIFQLFKEVL